MLRTIRWPAEELGKELTRREIIQSGITAIFEGDERKSTEHNEDAFELLLS